MSDEVRLYFVNNHSKLQHITSGVVRLHLPTGSCSGFYMGLGLIGTNEHDISQIKSSSSFTETDDIYFTPSLLKEYTTITNNDFDFAQGCPEVTIIGDGDRRFFRKFLKNL